MRFPTRDNRVGNLICFEPLLPGLGHGDPEGPTLIALYDVVSSKGTALVAGPVLEGRVSTHDVLDGQLYADVLQVVIGGRVPGCTPHRTVEKVLGRPGVPANF